MTLGRRWALKLGRTIPPILCGVFFFLGIFGPYLAASDPAALDLEHIYALPGHGHPLGTADNGVDILAVLLYGARLAAEIGVSVVGCSAGGEPPCQP